VSRRFPPIVVGVDGSPAAAAAAQEAAAEAHRRLLPVHLVQALDGPSPDRRSAGDRLEALRRALADRLPGGEVTATLCEGPAAEALLDEAGTAGLLVVGAPPTGPGDVVGEVTARAPCPVLVVRSTADHHGPVVVGVADDEGAARLLSAAALQATTRGTSLLVLDVGRGPAGTAHLGERVTAVRTTHPGVPVEWRPATRADLPTLLTAGRTAALVVMGRAGPHGGTDPRLGELVRRSASSVLVVPIDVPASSSLGPIRALTLSGGPS
jgi:nucleotide-binding universal stress UspA family protein